MKIKQDSMTKFLESLPAERLERLMQSLMIGHNFCPIDREELCPTAKERGDCNETLLKKCLRELETNEEIALIK